MQWRIQRRGPGGPGPPLFLDKNEARRAEKNFFKADSPPPPPYLRVWMTGPHHPIFEGLDPPLLRNPESCVFGIQLKESRIPLTIGIQNLSSSDKYWNPGPGI